MTDVAQEGTNAQQGQGTEQGVAAETPQGPAAARPSRIRPGVQRIIEKAAVEAFAAGVSSRIDVMDGLIEGLRSSGLDDNVSAKIEQLLTSRRDSLCDRVAREVKLGLSGYRSNIEKCAEKCAKRAVADGVPSDTAREMTMLGEAQACSLERLDSEGFFSIDPDREARNAAGEALEKIEQEKAEFQELIDANQAEVKEAEEALSAAQEYLSQNPGESKAYADLRAAHEELERCKEDLAPLKEYMQELVDKTPAPYQDKVDPKARCEEALGRLAELAVNTDTCIGIILHELGIALPQEIDPSMSFGDSAVYHMLRGGRKSAGLEFAIELWEAKTRRELSSMMREFGSMLNPELDNDPSQQGLDFLMEAYKRVRGLDPIAVPKTFEDYIVPRSDRKAVQAALDFLDPAVIAEVPNQRICDATMLEALNLYGNATLLVKVDEKGQIQAVHVYLDGDFAFPALDDGSPDPEYAKWAKKEVTLPGGKKAHKVSFFKAEGEEEEEEEEDEAGTPGEAGEPVKKDNLGYKPGEGTTEVFKAINAADCIDLLELAGEKYGDGACIEIEVGDEPRKAVLEAAGYKYYETTEDGFETWYYARGEEEEGED